MKNFDWEQYRDNLKNHQHYIEILHKKDTELIVHKLTEMVQDNLSQMAPVIREHISNKNANPLSQAARQALS